jgi:hypothetical protein
MPHGAVRNAELVPDDGEGKHHEKDGNDKFEGVHTLTVLS